MQSRSSIPGLTGRWGALLGGLAAAAVLAATGLAQAAEYVVLTSGQPSGRMSVTGTGSTREIRYGYNDRGRGPEVTSTVVLGADLTPARLEVAGVDYYKRAVAERFEREGATARWRAANDNGSVAAPGFYAPAEETPEHLAMLARALLRAGGELPLLPAGRARIEQALEAPVAGSARPARLYLISGLGFSPRPVWLDEAGELVLAGDSWFATVRRGAEAEAPRLIELQRQALLERERRRAPSLMRRADRPVAFRNVAVFDAEARAVRPAMTVVVDSGRIRAVGPTGSTPVPAAAQVIDAEGKTLLPGLFDMHTHVSQNAQGLLYLAAGVTTARDLGNSAEILERKRSFDGHQPPGPRILPAGFIDGPGPLSGPIKVLASTPDEMRAAIRAYADKGYRHIKLYSSLDPALVPVAAEEARRLGLRLSGHIPAGMTLRQAVEAGYQEVNHLNFVALNFMGPEINAKTNGITRITAIAEHAWQLDPKSPEVAELIALMKAKGFVVDPTMVLYEEHLLGRRGQPDPTLAAVIDRLPPVVRRGAMGAGLAQNETEAERNARSYARMQGLLKALYDGGVTLVPGTDAMAGFTLHRELELYVEAGIPAADVLHMATLGAARVAGVDAELGSIRPGKLADLVLVDGSPDQRISDVRKVSLVMKDGVLFEPDALLAEAGVAPRAR